VCSGVLQCAAVCCSVLQCVAVCPGFYLACSCAMIVSCAYPLSLTSLTTTKKTEKETMDLTPKLTGPLLKNTKLCFAGKKRNFIRLVNFFGRALPIVAVCCGVNVHSCSILQ